MEETHRDRLHKQILELCRAGVIQPTDLQTSPIEEITGFWRDRIIQSCKLPQRVITMTTEYNYASGTSETEKIMWSRRLLTGEGYYYPDVYTPETIEHYRENIGSDRDSSRPMGEPYEGYSIEQIAQIRLWMGNGENVKTSCKYYDNNPHLKCAVDPNLNCGQCSHYEYLDPTK